VFLRSVSAKLLDGGLAALARGAPAGPVIARQEHDFKERARRSLAAEYEAIKLTFRDLLLGVDPAVGHKMTPDQEQKWLRLRDHFAELGRSITAPENPAALDLLAGVTANALIGLLADALELRATPARMGIGGHGPDALDDESRPR
jgi:hypothetical protein